MINENRKKYYNEKSSEYLNHVSKETFAEDENSIKTEEGVKIGNFSKAYVPDENKNIIEATYYLEDSKLVLDKEGCELLNKCVQQIHKSFGGVVSMSIIQTTVFDWVFLRKDDQIKVPLCDYIEAKVQENKANFTCYFKIPFVSMPKNKCRNIAGVKIAYLTTETKKLLSKGINALPPSEYEDYVFAAVEIEGEKNSVQSLAYERANFAIDILKVNTDLRFAYNPLLASIGIEQSHHNSFMPLTITVNGECDDALIQKQIFGHKYPIDSGCLQMLNRSDYKIMVSFYVEYCKHEPEPSSLEKVIKRSISKFSQAISTSDAMEHIVMLCSIMDSIILSDNKVGIKESLTKYIPFIITQPGSFRERIKNSVSKMYDLRSKYIHHGDSTDVTCDELAEYNGIVYCLIVRLIVLRTNFPSIKDLQDHIDRTIMNIDFF